MNELIVLPSRNSIKYFLTDYDDNTLIDLGVLDFNGGSKNGVNILKKNVNLEDVLEVFFITPSNRVQIKSLMVNKVKKKYLANVILNENTDELQISESKHRWDYTIIDETNDQYKVLVSQVEKKYIENWISQLIMVNIEPSIVSAEQLSYLNSIFFSKGYEPVILVDIGRVDTNIILYDKDKEFFQMDVNIGGNDFIRNIKDIYDIDWDKAEKILKIGSEKDILEKEVIDEKPGLFKVVSSLIDNIIYEIKRSVIFYENRYQDIDFSEIILTGGVANIPNMAWYFSYEIGITTNKYNFFKNVKKDLKYKQNEDLNKNFLIYGPLMEGLIPK